MEEKILLEATVVFPLREDGAVLLAKKTMKIGRGCWNGYGGGREVGETLEQTAVRELQEESGLTAKVQDLKKIALLKSYNQKSDGRVVYCEVHFYTAQGCAGEVIATPEMQTPTWFAVQDIPLDELMPADKSWLPAALTGKKLIVTVYYSPFQQSLLQPVEIQEVKEWS